MITFFKGILKFTLFALLWTCLGQVPVKNASVEQHYHRAVNSETFQKTFWTLATPVTWTQHKIEYLIAKWKADALRKSNGKSALVR